MSTNNATTQTQIEYIPMVLQALREMDGSGRAGAVKGWIADKITASGKDLSDTILASGTSKFGNDIQWARLYLVNTGFLEPMAKSGRGIWKLTAAGWDLKLSDDTGQKIYNASNKKAASETQDAPEDDEKQEQEQFEATKSWMSDLAKLLPALSAQGFERLCAYIMAESGMEAQVTGKSGDGGVDGEGLLPVGGFDLVKMRVAWQCKRFMDGNVSSSAIRDFRGAISGRADYGIFFTTATYTTGALTEAKRPGAVPVQLVDLKALIDILGKQHIGVIETQHLPGQKQIDTKFFQAFQHSHEQQSDIQQAFI